MITRRRIPGGRRLTAAGCAALLAGAAVLTAAPAHAQDSRLVTVRYNPDEVVQIRGRVKVQATIRFAEDERIENVAIGDSNAWQVTPNKRANLLFIKPLETNAATNMTVVTNLRTYFFDLVAGNTGRPVYVLNFDYPEPPAGTRASARLLAEAAPAQNTAAEAAAPPETVDPAALNFAWATKGDRRLLPERVFDDGQSTFLTWPSGRDVPAILMLAEDGKTEGPVNFSVRGDTVVVEGVPAALVFRSGRAHATLSYGGKPLPVREAEARARRTEAAAMAAAARIEPEWREMF
ncbi:type VI secretion protein [Erythrobacteraceae bacterium CFH 75059]|uniref:TrbG/VirB9 family P-type conjugative transfer protein n=1 Tax=Qipengyuania thermophila TaxID=2509361 RepID=UPI00101F6836|nr:TrbG/VirB9 family P-type conjugative transfer protein [Qipengyuania thermophila]TCD01883.1 type VI secretion protein [Erythrobacteraceae bacterium CFH 75059]